MKLIASLLIAVSMCPLAASRSDAASVDEYLSKLGCAKVLRQHGETYSSDKMLRFRDGRICVSKDKKEAILIFEAAEMGKHQHLGHDYSPHVRMRLKDENLNEIWWSEGKIGLVEVVCGGYATIVRKIPPKEAAAAYDFEFDFKGTGGEPCGAKKDIGKQIVGTLAEVVRVVESGGKCSDCSEDEQILIDFGLKYLSTQ